MSIKESDVLSIFNENNVECPYFSALDLSKRLSKSGESVSKNKKVVNRHLYSLKKKGHLDYMPRTPPLWFATNNNNAESSNNDNTIDNRYILIIDLNSYNKLSHIINDNNIEAYGYINRDNNGGKFTRLYPNMKVTTLESNAQHSIAAKMIWDVSKLALDVSVNGDGDKVKFILFSNTKIIRNLLNLIEEYDIDLCFCNDFKTLPSLLETS